MRFVPLLEALEDRCLMDVSLNVGPNVDISQFRGNEAEGTITINPANPQRCSRLPCTTPMVSLAPVY